MNDLLEAHTATAVVDAPTPGTPPAGTLVASASPLRNTDGTLIPFDDWKRGLAWGLYDTQAVRRAMGKYPNATTQCPTNLDLCRPDKTDSGDMRAWPTLLSFSDGCMVSDIADWEARVRAVLDADSGSQLAAYLWTGVSGLTTAPAAFVTESASFTSEADIVDATARHPVRVFSKLIDAMRTDGYRGRLWFHTSESLLPHLVENDIVTQVGNTYRMGGHVVVTDPGYPRDITGQTASAAGEAWIVASGPVEYALGPIETFTPTDLTCADPTWEAKRLGFARFAGTPTVGAVKASRVLLWGADV